MKRIATGLAFAALAGWIAVGAISARPPSARAQGQSPTPIEIHRVQRAGFVPAVDGTTFIAVIGSDARPGQQVDRLRADSIHILAVNAQEGAASILGFPRDSYVPIPGSGTRKINDALAFGGPDLVVQTLSGLTGIQFDYYALTSFQGLTRMVNLIEGIEIEILQPMFDSASGTHFDPGRIRLDGEDALAFTRDRHSFGTGDFARSENHGRLMVAALEEFHRQVEQDPSNLFKWLAVGRADVITDLTFEELFDLGVTALAINPRRVRNCVVPGTTGSAGGGSVVFISSEAGSVYADLRDDGVLGSC